MPGPKPRAKIRKTAGWKQLSELTESSLLASRIRWPEMKERGLTPLVLKSYKVSRQAMLKMGVPQVLVDDVFKHHISFRPVNSAKK